MKPATAEPGQAIARLLVKSTELEPFQQDEFIVTGHRRRTDSYRECFKSIFAWHNESVNIHSHLWASLFFLWLFVDNILQPLLLSAPSRDPATSATFLSPLPVPVKSSSLLSLSRTSVSYADTLVFSIFLLGAVLCLGCSASFHCCSCHSPQVCATFNRMDHLGIVVLIVASFVPALFYGFYCEPFWQRVYISAVTLLGCLTAYAVYAPRFRSPNMKRHRAYLFISLGLSGVGPVAHALLRDGWDQSNKAFGLQWLLLEGVLYIVGALLYAERWPERTHPFKFDFFGSSHQIFHVLINLAAGCHWVGICYAFRYRHGGVAAACLGWS